MIFIRLAGINWLPKVSTKTFFEARNLNNLFLFEHSTSVQSGNSPFFKSNLLS